MSAAQKRRNPRNADSLFRREQPGCPRNVGSLFAAASKQARLDLGLVARSVSRRRFGGSEAGKHQAQVVQADDVAGQRDGTRRVGGVQPAAQQAQPRLGGNDEHAVGCFGGLAEADGLTEDQAERP